MEGRKWGELNKDCLVKVFEKVGLAGMMFAVPSLCNSWYETSKDPECWKDLDFASCETLVPYKNHTKLVKFAVDRSGGKATRVVFQRDFKWEAVKYVSDGCPLLKSLIMPPGIWMVTKEDISNVLKELNCLEEFNAGILGHSFEDIVDGLELHGKNLVRFTAQGFITERVASAIVNLPRIKYLSLSDSTLPRQNLIMILTRCKQLELLDVTSCIGFNEDDDEILKMASDIKNFLPQGSAGHYLYRNCTRIEH